MAIPWWEIASLAAGFLSDKPERESFSGPRRPDRSNELNQMMGDAFNPQSNLYRLAQEQYANNMQSQLARMGMSGSSLGIQAQQSGSANLANKFLENEMNRRRQALMTEADYYNSENKNAQIRHSAGNTDYGYDLNDAGSVVRSIGNLGSTFRENNRWDQMMDLYK